MKNQRKILMPVLTRVADVQPQTLNREKRTVEVVFTKGAEVRRSSWFDGTYYEELGLDKGQVRMGRLNNGAPFLDTHGFGDKRGVRNVLGVVESATLVPGKEGRAVIRFSKRAEVEDIFKDVEDGILRNVSVGYNTYKAEKVEERDGVPVFRATDWEPVEISLVPAGADDGAKVRSSDYPTNDCIVIDEKKADTDLQADDPSKVESRSEPEKTVAETKNLRDTQSTSEGQMDEKEKQKLAEEAKAEAKAAEKKRHSEIRALVKKVGLDEKLAESYIEQDKSVEDVRALVIEELAKRDKKPETQTRSTSPEVGEDLSRKGRVEGMVSALLHRFRPQTQWLREHGKEIKMSSYPLSDAGRQFAYMSLVEMARTCLEANGVRTAGMNKAQIADAALKMRSLHSTSDFPEILANVANKTLRDGYLAAPQTWRPFTREVTAPDFKQISRTNLGDAPRLDEVPEGGEVTRGSMSEAAEKYNVKEYAKIVAVTRKVIVNDDLQAFTRVPERMGRRAADLESDLVWDIIKANALLADGFALFSSQHGNLSTAPAAPSETGLNEARAAMRRQKGLDGAEISLIPMWLYVPPAHETAAEKLVATITPQSSGNVNPFSASGRTPLQLGVEPRLETTLPGGGAGSLTAWFVMADLGQIDMVELARLEGQDGPMIETRDGFDVNGVEIKVQHDVAAKAIDYRGLFKNAGA